MASIISYKKLLIILPLLSITALLSAFAYKKPSIHKVASDFNIEEKSVQEELLSLLDKATDLANKHKSPDEITITFYVSGDLSLSRNIAHTIDKHKDETYPLRKLSELLKKADFNIANLETPFSKSDKYVSGGTVVFNSPKKNIKLLTENNFAYVSLANNHALDQGISGITETRNWLDQNNIKHSGTGSAKEEAWVPAVIENKNYKICAVSASYGSNTGNPHKYIALMSDTESLKKAIQHSKSICDFTLIMMHAGIEYKKDPNKQQIDFAHTAIDEGADIVIGHHPHWVQTIEEYKGKKIYYSLGNFVFDQNWSKETSEGLLLKITLKGKRREKLKNQALIYDLQNTKPAESQLKIDNIEEIPFIIKENCCPEPK